MTVEPTLQLAQQDFGSLDYLSTIFEMVSLSFPLLYVPGYGSVRCVIESLRSPWLVFRHSAGEKAKSVAHGDGLWVCADNIR